jgi:hypothetical protein
MYRAMAMMAVALSGLVLGCVRVQPGLANAPALGTTPGADGRQHDRGHDVIANGEDSCGRQLDDAGPLRNRVPPCVGAPEPASSSLVNWSSPFEREVVRRWLEHYHSAWACPDRLASAGTMLVAWPPTDLRASSCALP